MSLKAKINAQFLKDSDIFDSFLQHLNPIPITPELGLDPDGVLYSFDVTSKHCNKLGSVHGGCIATILDDVTSFALPSELITVSVDMNVSFLRGIPKDVTIYIYGAVIRIGRTLAFVSGKIFSPQDPSIIYTTFTQTKFILNPPSKL